jgi:protein FRG1
MAGVRGGKLRLKGERSSKYLSPPSRQSNLTRRLPRVEKITGSQSAAPEEETAEQKAKGKHDFSSKKALQIGWADAESIADLAGPLVLVAVDEEPFVMVCEEIGNITARKVSELNLSCDTSLVEPNDVSQVFVGQSLIPGQYSLKSAFGRYLTCDTFGKVTATKEAVGPAEEWRPIKVEGGFAFQNVHDKFLSIDRAVVKVRADMETVGFNETFLVRCQASRKVRTKKSSEQVQPNFAIVEKDETRKHVSWGGGRLKMKKLSHSQLTGAEQEGRLHEALLEQRMKSKHDPFC